MLSLCLPIAQSDLKYHLKKMLPTTLILFKILFWFLKKKLCCRNMQGNGGVNRILHFNNKYMTLQKTWRRATVWLLWSASVLYSDRKQWRKSHGYLENTETEFPMQGKSALEWDIPNTISLFKLNATKMSLKSFFPPRQAFPDIAAPAEVFLNLSRLFLAGKP